MSSDKTRIERIIDQINAKNAKKVALFLVIGFVCYHGILHIRYGANSCKWLLYDGRYKGDQEWQPYGCMLHRYTKIDTRKCLQYIAYYGGESSFAFIGDSRIQDLYIAFVNHLKQDDEGVEPPKELLRNMTHVDEKLRLKVEFFGAPLIAQAMTDKFREWALVKIPPSVVVAGSALEAIKVSNGSKISIEEYKVNITRIIKPISNLYSKKSKVLWALQEPVDEDKLKPELGMISNDLIDLYNKVASEILSYSDVELWRSIKLVGEGMLSSSPDGIKLGSRPLQFDVQIVINMYCNDYMNFNDGTCCSSTEVSTTLQIVTFIILSICIIVAVVMVLYRLLVKLRGREYRPVQQDPDASPPIQTGSYKLFTSLAKIALIMLYFFVCDRTNFFMKENKYYSEFSFWLPIAYVTVLGLFFTEDSKFTKVLHRDQLNEWKGWMLLVILVYHITGASRILLINMHIKVLISSYLFLMGYEQFCYIWRRGDIGIVSFFRVLFRLNFMTVTLCLCMNRPYQFYYFVPLLSFWFLMTYCFLTFPPQITAQTSENNLIQFFYLLIKFIVLFTVITILFMSEVFFEKIFVTRPWKALFVTTDDDIREWWFRWKLDRYSIMYGMGFAIILLFAQKYNIYDDNNHSNLFSRGLALTGTLAAIMGLGCYIIVNFLCTSELECSEIHSYIVFIPIISYIVLRNISGVLRTRYSSLFAWFGEISLELFISQYHIWLAADTHGVLVLIPGYPVLNVMITSFIFVCASHEIHQITKVLLPYAVPSDWKSVLRNFILFLAILVPIGINDGMF